MNEKCNKKIIRQTENGKIIKCYTCNQYHIEYNNLHFTFSKEEFVSFRNYFLELDVDYWEAANTDTIYNRKIMVPVGHKNVTTLFKGSEIIELRSLLSITTRKPEYMPSLNFKAISSGLIWN